MTYTSEWVNWWERPEGDDPSGDRGRLLGSMRWTFEVIEGRHEPIAVEVRAVPGPLTATELRKIRIQDADGIRRRQSLLGPTALILAGEVDSEKIRGALREWNDRRAPNAKYGREHYETVARLYREGYELGKTPTKHVAFKMGELMGNPVSIGRAAKWVSYCRKPEVGLLPPTSRGKPRTAEPG